MTIKEFIENVNQVAYVDKGHDYIYIFLDQEAWRRCCANWFLRIDPAAQGLDSDCDWKCAESLRDVDMFYILGLVQKLRKTPVEDRFPEKKYRLYVMRNAVGPIPDKCYLSDYDRDSTKDHFGYANKENACVLTKNEIENLSSYSPLIDVFEKEEVCEDD